MRIGKLNATELLNEYSTPGNNTAYDPMIRRRFLELKPGMTQDELAGFARYNEFAFVLAIDEIFKGADEEQKQVGGVINAIWGCMSRDGSPLSDVDRIRLIKEISKIELKQWQVSAEDNRVFNQLFDKIQDNINTVANSDMQGTVLENLMESVGQLIDSIKTTLGLEVEERAKFTIKPSVLEKVEEGLGDAKHVDSLGSKAKNLKDAAKNWREKVSEPTGKSGYER